MEKLSKCKNTIQVRSCANSNSMITIWILPLVNFFYQSLLFAEFVYNSLFVYHYDLFSRCMVNLFLTQIYVNVPSDVPLCGGSEQLSPDKFTKNYKVLCISSHTSLQWENLITTN